MFIFTLLIDAERLIAFCFHSKIPWGTMYPEGLFRKMNLKITIMESALDKISLEKGVVLKQAGTHTNHFEYIIPRSGCVITSIIDEDGKEWADLMGVNGVTLAVSDIAIRIPGGKVGFSVVISAGSAWLVLI